MGSKTKNIPAKNLFVTALHTDANGDETIIANSKQLGSCRDLVQEWFGVSSEIVDIERIELGKTIMLEKWLSDCSDSSTVTYMWQRLESSADWTYYN